MLQLTHKSYSFIIAFAVYSMEIVLLGSSRKGVLKLVSAVIEQGVKETACGSAMSLLHNAFINVRYRIRSIKRTGPNKVAPPFVATSLWLFFTFSNI